MRYRAKMVQFKTVNYDKIQDMNDAIKNRCDLQYKIVWFMSKSHYWNPIRL